MSSEEPGRDLEKKGAEPDYEVTSDVESVQIEKLVAAEENNEIKVRQANHLLQRRY
jgi:hypothetical protein